MVRNRNKYNKTIVYMSQAIVYMYQASHVKVVSFVTIVAISTTCYFNQSLPVSHTTGSSYWSPHSSRIHPDMAYGYYYPNERVTK